MKKVYNNPIVNVLAIDEKDIIVTSVLGVKANEPGMVQTIDDIMGL